MTALDDVRRLDRQYFDDHPDLCTFCRPMFAAEYQALCRIHEVPQHCSIRDGLVHVTKSTQTTRTFSWRHHPGSKRPA